MPHYIQPSLFPEYDFAVVRTRDAWGEDYFRAECKPCRWHGWATLEPHNAETEAHAHNAEHHG